MIPSYSSQTEGLCNEEGSESNAWIVLGQGNRIDFTSGLRVGGDSRKVLKAERWKNGMKGENIGRDS